MKVSVPPDFQADTQSRSVEKTVRLDYLDSIRGLAALAVFFGHFFGSFTWPRNLLNTLRLPFVNALIDGHSAVAMFFVLSGFVLSRPYFVPPSFSKGATRRMEIAPFYAKRIARIFIPFVSALLLSAFAKAYLFTHYETIPPQTDWFRALWSYPVGMLDFLKQCVFLVHDPNMKLVSQDWSLGIELKASLLLPFFLMATRRNIFWLLIIAALMTGSLKTGHFYFSFLLGIILARFMPLIQPTIQSLKSRWKALLLVTGTSLYEAPILAAKWGVYASQSVAFEKFLWSLTSLGCLLTLIVTLSSNSAQKTLNHGMLTYLGRISYSVYLLHFIVIFCAVPWLIHYLNGYGIIESATLLAIVPALILVLLISTAAYQYIELPSIRLGRWLSLKLRSEDTKKMRILSHPTE